MDPARVDMTIELTPILVCVLTCILGWLGWLIKSLISANVERDRKADKERAEQRKLRKEEHDEIMERLDALDDADRSILRSKLIGLHREWAEDKGYITLEAKEHASKTYSSYHRLGGNGIGTSLYDDILKLPVREER